MKDFTLYHHIAPSIEEIKSKYDIHNDSIVKEYFNCDLLLKKKNSNNCIVVRKADDFYISGIKALNALRAELTDYCLSIETYSGELDDWEKRQEQEILNAIKDYLIWQFTY